MSPNKMAFRLTNATKNTMTLLLEPWGERYHISSGATLMIEAQGPSGDSLEVEYVENGVIVYGWSGSTVSVSETNTGEGAGVIQAGSIKSTHDNKRRTA